MVHKIKHTGEFTCSNCKKSFSTKDILINHICAMKPPVVEVFNCTICNKAFSKERYLFKHLPVHTGHYTCRICGKWLSSEASLTNHTRLCSQVKEIEDNGQAKCPNCQEIFTDVTEFRRHQYEHIHVYGCETCGARFRNRLALDVHICQGKDLTCDICNKIFINNESLQRHKSIHGETVHKCSDCGKCFHWEDSLLKHSCKKDDDSSLIEKIKSENLTQFICEICGSNFSCKSSLKIHKTLHGQKNFTCDVCGKKFHRRDILVQHQTVHRDPSYQCQTCNKLFKTRRSLATHLMIHDGIKQFRCGKCGKEFFQKRNLQRHEETHNINRDKYICSYCQKSFSTLELQYLHMLEHSKTCGVCGRSFLKEEQLLNHHKTFHSNQCYTCKYCKVTVKLRQSMVRHLKDKHKELESEWKLPEVLNSMVMKRKTPATATNPAAETNPSAEANQSVATTEETNKVSESNEIPVTTEETEVSLTTVNNENQEIQTFETDKEQIKQETSPDVLQISVPFNNNNASSDEQIISTTENDDDIIGKKIVQIELKNSSNKQYVTIVDESDPKSKSNETSSPVHSPVLQSLLQKN